MTEITPTLNERQTPPFRSRAEGARHVMFNVTEPRPVKLTDEDRARVNARAMKGLLHAVMAQAAMAGVAALVAWMLSGSAAAVSALAGAGVYFLPNTLFAIRLMIGLAAGRTANPITFFLGEMLKLAVTVMLLWLLSRYAQDWLVWPAVLWGLVLTLKGYFLLLMFRKLS